MLGDDEWDLGVFVEGHGGGDDYGIGKLTVGGEYGSGSVRDMNNNIYHYCDNQLTKSLIEYDLVITPKPPILYPGPKCIPIESKLS
jgi:hypothetical protein